MADPAPNLFSAEQLQQLTDHLTKQFGGGGMGGADNPLNAAMAKFFTAKADRAGRNPLGAVATANSRTPGKTLEADWRATFGDKTDPSTMPARSIFTPPRTDAGGGDPYALGAVGPGVRDPVAPWQYGSPSAAAGLPYQGMIDSSLPDAQKYKDSNFFKVQPGKSSLPPGAVVGDENGSWMRSPLPSASAPIGSSVAAAPMNMDDILGFVKSLTAKRPAAFA